MERYYIFKDGQNIGSFETREEAIEMIRTRQKRETHFMLKSEFSVIKGVEEIIPYKEGA